MESRQRSQSSIDVAALRAAAVRGDLDGRVEDIRLVWNDDELREVLRKGSDALNIEMQPELVDEVISDAFGNVGLVQRIAEEICMAAGVFETRRERLVIGAGGELTAARQSVSEKMRALRRVC